MSGMQWSSNSDKLINLAGATEYLQTLQEDIILLKLTWLTLFDLLAVCTAGSMSWHQKWRYLLWQWNTNKHYDPQSHFTWLWCWLLLDFILSPGPIRLRASWSLSFRSCYTDSGHNLTCNLFSFKNNLCKKINKYWKYLWQTIVALQCFPHRILILAENWELDAEQIFIRWYSPLALALLHSSHIFMYFMSYVTPSIGTYIHPLSCIWVQFVGATV